MSIRKVLKSSMRNIKQYCKIVLEYKGLECSKEDKKIDTSIPCVGMPIPMNRNSKVINSMQMSLR